jgi:signal transduction histidine kinase
MKITTRYMLNFGFLVAGILLIYSVIIITFYFFYRSEDFYIRLKNKAVNSATLLFNVKGISYPLLKIIDDKTVTNMNNVTVIILNKDRKVVYSNHDSLDINNLLPTFRKLNWDRSERHLENKTLFISFQRSYNGSNFYILASGSDLYGQAELQKLLVITLISFLISLLIIIGASYFNALQSVRPLKSIIKQIKMINPGSLKDRLSITAHDEIAELSSTFNSMLSRIEKAVENQRMFVSNVSHELRTPVTSIIGQLEVALLRDRSETEYKTLVLSVLDDMKNLKTIINGFFALAESDIDNIQSFFNKVRMDELLFSTKDDILRRSKFMNIQIEFENIPDDENELMVYGSEHLLKLLVSNLIDNACKFSDPPKVKIIIAFINSTVSLLFIDNGIGIPDEDIKHIFEPLFRAKNVGIKSGYGIGLSIVKRIADIHDAKIDIESELNIGTTIKITFPVVKPS